MTHWIGSQNGTRIFITRNAQNLESRATNTALHKREGEYIKALDHDDELTYDALFEVVRARNAKPRLTLYIPTKTYVTPDGSPKAVYLSLLVAIFRSVMFIGHLLMVRRGARSRGLRPGL